LTTIEDQTLDEGTTKDDFVITASDPDGDSLTLQATGLLGFMTFTDNGDGTALLKLEPGQDDAGSYDVTVNVNDGNGGSTYQTFTVSVIDVPITERVSDGLEMLYYFDSISGSTISPAGGSAAVSLEISDTSSVSSVPNGLSINSPVVILSTSKASTLRSHLRSTNAITIEAWIKPKSSTMSGTYGGIAQIFSVSEWGWYGTRNFTLGQNGNRYQVRLNVGWEGTIDGGSVSTSPTHVLYTRDASGSVKLYVNGAVVATQSLGGNFSGWKNYKVVLANEDGMSPYGGSIQDYDWAGTYYLLAVYNRALSNDEVQQNYTVGGAWVP
jgi:hypothetical protein